MTIYCRYLIFLLIINLFQTNLAIASSAVDEIRMTIPRTEKSYYGKLAGSLYHEAFNRLGVSLTLIRCSPLKCAHFMKTGLADGTVGRTQAYQEKIPTSIRVEESVFSINFSVFTINQTMRPLDLDAFLNSKQRIAFVSGNFFLEKELIKYSTPEKLMGVKHWADGLFRLNNGEVDVFIGVEKTALLEIKNKNYSKIKFAGVFAKVPIYAFFNNKHQKLASKLSKVFQQMKQDGTMQRLEKSVAISYDVPSTY